MKSSTSVESATQNGSTSLLNEHNSLCSWLALDKTQDLLNLLEEEAVKLNRVLLETAPGSRKEEVIREQAIGHIRGLRFLGQWVELRQQELTESLRQELQTVPSDSEHDL